MTAPDLLHEHFARRARATPDAVALLHGDRSITYAELAARAAGAAGALRAGGVGPGALVGLHVDRSIDWVVGLLAILESGAAVVPLPPSDPPGRLREIASFARLDAIVDAAATPLPAGIGVGARTLEALMEGTGSSAAPGPVDVDPDRAAFVLSSSGSTGRPKLIVRSHRSFFHRLRWTWARHPFRPGDVGSQKSHATTTHAIYELFEPLLGGAPTLIVADADARDLERFWDLLRERRVTRLLIVPSALRAALDVPGFRPPDLDVLVLMGEYVPPALADRAAAAWATRTGVYSIYGSTEASSALVTDLRAPRAPGGELALGSPLAPGIRPLVLDADLAPVPAGGEGRLHLAGPHLFTEYLNDPEGTAAVRLRIPAEPAPVYDTRDRVRIDADGALRFVGRTDDMVKVRGFRVDLNEVERALAAAPGVRRAAVVAAPAGGQVALVGFATPADLDRDAVYRSLRGGLVSYMVPSTLVLRDALPLTASGKVDRVGLLAEHARTPSAGAGERTGSATERKVAAIWEEVLGHADFDFAHDFFEVGGTSLNVFALVRRLRDVFSVPPERLAVETVYGAPSVARLAAALERASAGAEPAPAPPVSPLVTLRGGRDDRPPLFVVAPAGGTLGAYEKLARALTASGVVGVRDPFVLGRRDAGEGFDRWVDRYVAALRERQPEGPFHVCGYSSAGAFAYEIARRLRAGGREVALLVLVDPLGMHRPTRREFGHWTMKAIWMRPPLRRAVRWIGRLRGPWVRAAGGGGARLEQGDLVTAEEVRRAVHEAPRERGHVLNLAALFELNTGMPVALREADLADVPPDRYLDVLHARIAQVVPDLDRATLERIAVQYQLQLRVQQVYRLRPYGGRVWLFEPATPHAGLVAALLRPYVAELRARALPVGAPSARVAELARRWGRIDTHYRCMRDDEFVRRLAAALDEALARTS